MSYQVIARKYRPQNFQDLVGQENISRTLQNALKSGRIAHAFLFSGVRGVGKTTAARILAKALNCREGISPEPCDSCDSCKEIRNVNSVDVQEIDAASNRGIDSIRELRESVRYGTARDRFKIFIIDEVHMLTNEAFNALLKTLEEPPDHVKFIMATTEIHKIPTTITSRCQKYEFKTISFSAIFKRLKEITKTEEIAISDYALSAIATVAQGSMRDAQSALDQVLAFSGSQVEDEDVKALLGLVDQGAISSLVASIFSKDSREVIEQVTALTTSGISPQILGEKLAEHFRNLLIIKIAGWDESLLQLPDTSRQILIDQASGSSETDLIRFYDLTNRTAGELKWHSQPAIHLEMTLLKMIELAHLPSLEEVISNLSGTPVDSNFNPPKTSSAGSGQNLTGKLKSKKQEKGSDPSIPDSIDKKPSTKVKSQSREIKDSANHHQTKKTPSLGGNNSFVRVEQDEVKRFMDGAEKNFTGLFEQLKRASTISLSEGKLRILFPRSESFSASLIQTDQNRLSDAFSNIMGSKPAIDIRVEDTIEEDSIKEPEPTEDPKVQIFLNRFPGKITVRKEKNKEE
jgi:DNA polymerase-3 subunit gamma/tau